VSLRFDLAAARVFFDEFFSLPDELWFGYLTGTASSSEVAATMRALFRAAPLRLKARLVMGNPLSLRGVGYPAAGPPPTSRPTMRADRPTS
jgi:hypothetical protein